MRKHTILAKLVNFGTMMNQWGKTPERDEYREIARTLQTEMKEAISDKWDLADQSYELYKLYENGTITADQAIKAIGALHEQ